MKRPKPLPGHAADDRGAALLLVLVVVTVIALAGAALLAFSSTSIRATVGLRDPAAAAYAADGAGQVALAQLAAGTYPNDCATLAGNPLSLGNGTNAFYPAPTDPVSPAPAPVCTATYAAFRPGLHKDLTSLSGTCGQKSVVWFSPGTYYFDFTGTWTASARLVGGTATAPVSAQTGCKADTCALFTNSVNGHSDFHIQGFTYSPNARIVLTLKNSPGQVFSWGLVLRSFALTTNGASPDGALIQLPADCKGGTITYTIMYLNVWVCPVSGAACDHSGAPQLRAKVQVTGTPATAEVLSWSVQR